MRGQWEVRECLSCGRFYNGVTATHVGCEVPSKAKESSTDMPVHGVVVSTPEDLARVARHRVESWHARMRAAGVSFGSRSARLFRRSNMGKIHGVHDSYCALVSPSNRGPGDPPVCTCDTGKATSKVFDEADWQVRAEAYADDFIGKLVGIYPSDNQTMDQRAKMRAMLITTWKAGHPRTQTVDWDKERLRAPADAPPAAPPAEDGPGEEDGPQTPGCPERAGVESPPAVDHEAHCRWDMSAGGKCTCRMSRFGKFDQGKPKPFQFFMQQFPLSVGRVALHMEKGCGDPGHVFLGWAEVENGFARYTDAMLRHLLEEVMETVTLIDHEEGYDREWAEEQAAIATAANAMIRLELLLRRRRNLNLDARPGA